ncbi:MAG: DUF1553 domain-containing protein [Pirellulaceae bacterium]|nr:DUF1553 domain-containing protein [Pirellulaceae bacterium]
MAIRFLPFGLVVLVGCLLHPNASANETAATIDFTSQIQPIFRSRCYSCHGFETSEAGLRLDQKQLAFSGGDSGHAISPGQSGKSPLISRITSHDPDQRMPPEGKPLSAKEVSLLTKWIDAGAIWPDGIDPADPAKSHWAYQPIASPALPSITHPSWPRNGIDHFVLHQLETHSIAPARKADRSTLIRRLHLDLIGLPPTDQQWQHWIACSQPNWYEQLVEKLLASPHYGERWGRYWLDLARYADSDGYEKDEPRPHAYQWRDWVIRAINRDLPFDQFTEQQIAGDLLPGATPDVKLATGFHRNTLTNREGGIDKEEDRVKQVVDRTNTVSTVWLGLTFECAQCHTHKYDPITQHEYYQLYAFFNSSDETNFQLEPTRAQLADFEREKRQYAVATETAEKELKELQVTIEHQAEKLEAEWLEKNSQQTSRLNNLQAIAHFTFDGKQPLKNRVDEKEAKFLGEQAPRVTPSNQGRAIDFNGSNDRIEFTVKEIPQPNHHPVTISAWCYYRGGIGAIVTKMNESASFRGIDFTVNNGILEVHLVDTWPQDAIKVTTKTKIAEEQWQHLLMRYDGSRKASGIQIFIDGKPQPQDVHFDQLAGDFAIDQPWRIGSRREGGFFHGQIDEVRVYQRALDVQEVVLLASDPRLEAFLAIASIPTEDRLAEQQTAQLDFLISKNSRVMEVEQLLSKLSQNPPQLAHGTGIGLAQRDALRPTHVHLRGEFLQKGAEVATDTPNFLHTFRARGTTPDRLDLARWILARDNHLTPRVTVNRFWQMLFGHGLVNSDRDFGSQGTLPTHPKLLDWLASRFVANDWSVKQLHRLIVNSATYQQSSAIRPELLEIDPNNHWLARQNRLRVNAETVRDLALATSGLLDPRIHGESVYPPLPPGTVELAFVDVINRGPWQASEGGDRYRRGVYTFFQRTSAYPMLSLFDAPDSNTTCTRRERSNTPLQALALWNDPVFMECAKHLALRAVQPRNSQDLSQPQKIAAAIYTIGLSRSPTAGELDDLTELYQSSLHVYESNPGLAREILTGTTPPAPVSEFELAAWISVARTVMNLDGFINRN